MVTIERIRELLENLPALRRVGRPALGEDATASRGAPLQGVPYFVRRLQRSRPDLVRDLLAGRIRSVAEAVRLAGFKRSN